MCVREFSSSACHDEVMHLSMSSPTKGGGGSGNPWEFDRDAYPQGEDFDLTSCI